jgi:hypothetical protein
VYFGSHSTVSQGARSASAARVAFLLGDVPALLIVAAILAFLMPRRITATS